MNQKEDQDMANDPNNTREGELTETDIDRLREIFDRGGNSNDPVPSSIADTDIDYDNVEKLGKNASKTEILEAFLQDIANTGLEPNNAASYAQGILASDNPRICLKVNLTRR